MGHHPGGEGHDQEDDVFDPRLEVGVAVGRDLHRGLAQQVERDRDVVRPERPEGVLVRAHLAEVDPLGIEVVRRADGARR